MLQFYPERQGWERVTFPSWTVGLPEVIFTATSTGNLRVSGRRREVK